MAAVKENDPPPFIQGGTEQERKDLDKTTAASSGKNAKDSKAYTESVEKNVQTIKSGRFLAATSAAISLPTAAAVGGAGGLPGISAGKVGIENLNAPIQNTLKIPSVANANSKLGLGALNKLVDAANNVVGTLVAKLLNELAKFLFIPDPVFTASIIAYDIAGADLEMDQNYIRNVILKRDITMALQWWNKEWEIKYTGLTGDPYSRDAQVCSRNGCFENVMFILKDCKKEKERLENENKALFANIAIATQNDPRNAGMNIVQLNKQIESNARSNVTYSMNLSAIENIQRFILSTIKNTIVYSYTNFNVADLKKFLDTFNVDCAIFGSNAHKSTNPETRKYGRTYMINSSDINLMCPFYKPDSSNSAIVDVNKMMENIRSSRYRRMMAKREREGKAVPGNIIKEATTFIDPRNQNIKRLYTVLYERGMYNEAFAERLKYKIAMHIVKAIDVGLDVIGGLLPSNLFDTMKDHWESAYRYTKSIEKFLYDPANTPNFNLLDLTVIKSPSEVKNQVTSQVDPKTIDNSKSNAENVNNVNVGGALLLDQMNNNGFDMLMNNPDMQAYLENQTQLFMSMNLPDVMNMVLNDFPTSSAIAEWLRHQVKIKSSAESIFLGYFLRRKFMFFFEIDFLSIGVLLNAVQTGRIEAIRDKTITELLSETKGVIPLVDEPIYGNKIYAENDIVKTGDYTYYQCIKPSKLWERDEDKDPSFEDKIDPADTSRKYGHGDIVRIKNQYHYKFELPNHQNPDHDPPPPSNDNTVIEDPSTPEIPTVSLGNVIYWKKLSFPTDLLALSNTSLDPDDNIKSTSPNWNRVDKMNRDETILVYRFMLEHIQETLRKRLYGEKFVSVSLDKLLDDVLKKINLGLSTDYGTFEDRVYLTIDRLNALIHEFEPEFLSNDSWSPKSIREFQLILERIVAEVNRIVADQTVVERSIDPVRNKGLKNLLRLSNDMKFRGSDSATDLENFVNGEINNINKEIEETNSKFYDMAGIDAMLAEFGVDTSEFRTMDYFVKLSDQINSIKPDNYYDFDIDDPPLDVREGIEFEMRGGTSMTYRWRDGADRDISPGIDVPYDPEVSYRKHDFCLFDFDIDNGNNKKVIWQAVQDMGPGECVPGTNDYYWQVVPIDPWWDTSDPE